MRKKVVVISLIAFCAYIILYIKKMSPHSLIDLLKMTQLKNLTTPEFIKHLEAQPQNQDRILRYIRFSVQGSNRPARLTWIWSHLKKIYKDRRKFFRLWIRKRVLRYDIKSVNHKTKIAKLDLIKKLLIYE